MKIPENINREDILQALKEIDLAGIPPRRESSDYDLVYIGRAYPPKYVISVANRVRNGKFLDPDEFISTRARKFLSKLGFEIIQKRRINQSNDQITDNRSDNVFTGLNTILFGPPGTGKTYRTKFLSLKIITRDNDEPNL